MGTRLALLFHAIWAVAGWASDCPFLPRGGQEALDKILTDTVGVLKEIDQSTACEDQAKTSAVAMSKRVEELRRLRDRNIEAAELNATLREIESATESFLADIEKCSDADLKARVVGSALDLSWAVMALAPEVAIPARAAGLVGIKLAERLMGFLDPRKNRSRAALDDSVIFPKIACLYWDLQNRHLDCGDKAPGNEDRTVAEAFKLAIESAQPFFLDQMELFHKDLSAPIGRDAGQDPGKIRAERVGTSLRPLLLSCALLASSQHMDVSRGKLPGRAVKNDHIGIDLKSVVGGKNPSYSRDYYQSFCGRFNCPHDPEDPAALKFLGDPGYEPEGSTSKEKLKEFFTIRLGEQARANAAATFNRLQCDLIGKHAEMAQILETRYLTRGDFCRLKDRNGRYVEDQHSRAPSTLGRPVYEP